MIQLEYKGTTYTLEYTRKTVQQMAGEGFSTDDLERYPIMAIPQLVYGAFKQNHRRLSKAEIDAIYEQIGDKQGFIGELGKMYSEVVENTLLSEPEDEKNVEWVVL